MNIQIVPTPDEDRNRILAEFKKQGGWIAKAEGRDDFVAIHASGGTKEHPTIKITQQNVNEVCDAMKYCLWTAAEWWAKNGNKK